MRLLITGGLGQVGSSLVSELSHHFTVIILDNYSNNFVNGNFTENVEIIEGDVRDFETVKEASNDADFIIHTAAQIDVERSIKNPLFDADINITGTLNLLEATRRNGNIKKFIYFSSAAVYGIPKHVPIDESHPLEPISPYGLSKLTGEKYCLMYHRLYKLPVVCIRPFNIYSEKQNPKNPYSSVITKFIERAKLNKALIIYGNGAQTRDFVHVNDVVSFIELILERDDMIGEVFNVGTGKVVSIAELANMVLKLSGKAELGPSYEQTREGDIKHSIANIKKARGVGYEPKISLENALKDIVNLFRTER